LPLYRKDELMQIDLSLSNFHSYQQKIKVDANSDQLQLRVEIHSNFRAILTQAELQIDGFLYNNGHGSFGLRVDVVPDICFR
jgi:hypothetical protein